MSMTVSEMMEAGLYDLQVDVNVGLEVGETFQYAVVKVHEERADASVPITICIASPERLMGRIIEARLVPRISADVTEN